MVHRLWELEGIVPVERCRLVKFDHFSDIPERSYEGLDDVAVCKLTNNSFAYCDLLLETREENEEFEVYKSSANGCVLKVSSNVFKDMLYYSKTSTETILCCLFLSAD